LLEAAGRINGVSTLAFDIGPKLARRSVTDFLVRSRQYRTRIRDFLVRSQYELGIDLLHVQFKKEQLLATPVADRLGIPVVWTEHGALPAQIARVLFARSRYVRCSRIARRVICVSGFVARDLEQHGVRRSLLSICYNGIDVRDTGDDDARARARAALGIAPETRLVLVVARLARVKGHHLILAAAPEILRRVPGVHFLFAGDGPEYSRLLAMAQRLGVAGSVTFAGHRDDVPALLEASDVVVAPSLAEGHPFSVLEAMAAERPVVGTRVGGIPEALGNGQAGVVVAPDPSELARGVIEVLQSPSRARTLGVAGRRRVDRHFTLNAMIDGTERVFAHASSRTHAHGLNASAAQ
jgi:glycosyltransferase involved in cell wall biosynthesis